MRPDLLRWQWEGYSQFHQSRLNLWLHLPAVLAFISWTITAVCAACTGSGRLALVALVGLVVAFAVQGVGHKREANPPIPFNGPIDAITRILAEQFITFPRFVMSGGWWAAVRAAK